jgi:hypothetical protein
MYVRAPTLLYLLFCADFICFFNLNQNHVLIMSVLWLNQAWKLLCLPRPWNALITFNVDRLNFDAFLALYFWVKILLRTQTTPGLSVDSLYILYTSCLLRTQNPPCLFVACSTQLIGGVVFVLSSPHVSFSPLSSHCDCVARFQYYWIKTKIVRLHSGQRGAFQHGVITECPQKVWVQLSHRT